MAARSSNIDEIDAKLLEMLQQHGRTSQHDLAQAVNLSSPAVGERLRKLEERGIIKQFTVLVDPKKLNRDVTAFVSVGIDGSKFYSDFLEQVANSAEILECHSVTGQGSHLLKIRTESTSSLEKLLSEIQTWTGVHWTLTSIVLSTVKETMQLHLNGD